MKLYEILKGSEYSLDLFNRLNDYRFLVDFKKLIKNKCKGHNH